MFIIAFPVIKMYEPWMFFSRYLVQQSSFLDNETVCQKGLSILTRLYWYLTSVHFPYWLIKKWAYLTLFLIGWGSTPHYARSGWWMRPHGHDDGWASAWNWRRGRAVPLSLGDRWLIPWRVCYWVYNGLHGFTTLQFVLPRNWVCGSLEGTMMIKQWVFLLYYMSAWMSCSEPENWWNP